MMLKKAAENRKVSAVSRFSDQDAKHRLEKAGVKTVAADLLDESVYAKLPKAKNVYYLAGRKFGAAGNQPLTWAMNSYVPTLAAQYYKD